MGTFTTLSIAVLESTAAAHLSWMRSGVARFHHRAAERGLLLFILLKRAGGIEIHVQISAPLVSIIVGLVMDVS